MSSENKSIEERSDEESPNANSTYNDDSNYNPRNNDKYYRDNRTVNSVPP